MVSSSKLANKKKTNLKPKLTPKARFVMMAALVGTN
jgi:hypothetical protein